jgi:ankyrin repeat protein
MSSAPPDGQSRLDLEQQRKRAKDLRRAHRDGQQEAAERILRHLPRAQGQSPAQVLASPFTLSDAQLVVAREAGFPSWPRLKHRIELARLGADPELEALLDAAVAGDADAVRARLATRPDLPERSIHAAAALGAAAAASTLLDADPSLAIRRGGLRQWTPLFYACSSRAGRGDRAVATGRARIAARLLELGADASETVDRPDARRSVLQNAAQEVAHVDLVDVLLRAGASLEPADLPEALPLSAAVIGGDRACLERLLAAGAADWHRREALEVAVFHDRLEITRLLLAHGAEPSRAGRWWGHLGSALHAAILLGRGRALLEVLLDSDVDLDARDRDGRTALAVAVRTGHDTAADLLRARGASPGDLDPVDHLIAACVRLDGEAVRRLLAADPALRTRYRYTDHTMLGWAIRQGRTAALPLLLAAGLDPDVPDPDGNTPLHLAAAAGDGASAAALEAAGASREKRDYRGRTPFGPAPAPEEQRERDELFERAADAVVAGDLEVLRDLLDDEPALVQARSPREHRATLLLYTGANGTEPFRQRTPANAPAIAQLLLDRGAEVDATGRFYGGGVGATTLGLVVTSGFPSEAGVQGDLVDVLCRAGADPDGPDGDGSPLWSAVNLGYAPAAEALFRHGARADNLVLAAAVGDLAAVRTYFDGSGRLRPGTGWGRSRAVARHLDLDHLLEYALIHAAGHGRLAVVEFLLGCSPDLTVGEPVWGNTALTAARFLHQHRQHDPPIPTIDRPGVIARLAPLYRGPGETG